MDFGDAGYIEGSQNGDRTRVKAKVRPIDVEVEAEMGDEKTEVEMELPGDVEVKG
jgi:hypothetical protein